MILRLSLDDCPEVFGAPATTLSTAKLELHCWTALRLVFGSSMTALQGRCSLATHGDIVDTAAGCFRQGRIESFSFGMTGTLCMCV
jgi:hypothetical protein